MKKQDFFCSVLHKFQFGQPEVRFSRDEVLKEVLIYEAKWTYLQNRQIFKNTRISTCDNRAGKFITLQLKPQTLILMNQWLICKAANILCKITHTDIVNRSKTDGIEMIKNSGSRGVNFYCYWSCGLY